MTIKSKLFLNVCIVTIMTGVVSATGFFGMRFIQERLSFLTERSTPYQIRSNKLQLAIEGTMSSLTRVGASRTAGEFNASRNDTQRSLDEVHNDQEALNALGGGERSGVYEELSPIRSELLSVTEARLKAETALNEAGGTIDRKLKEVIAKLMGLDTRIRTFQDGRSAAYSTSVVESGNISRNLRNVEAMRATAKELPQAVSLLDRAQSIQNLLVAKGRYNTIIAKALKNDYLKEVPEMRPDINQLGQKADELVVLKSALISRPGTDTRKYTSFLHDLNEKTMAFSLMLEQEVATADSNYGTESKKQVGLYGQSSLATGILADNARLVAQGIYINALSSRLFSLSSSKEIAAVEFSIKQEYAKLNDTDKRVSDALRNMHADPELHTVQSVVADMNSIKILLFEKDGVVDKIRRNLEMQEQAAATTEKLRNLVARQAEQGSRIGSAARENQEKAIISVHNMVRISTILIISMGLAAIAFGIGFGVWIYRSISRPLSSSIDVVNRIAEGQLNATIEGGRKDEIGQLLDAISRMAGNLRGVIQNVRKASESIADASDRLLTNAEQTASGSEKVAMQAGTVATASEEMAASSEGIARSCATTSEESQRISQSTEKSSEIVREAMQGMGIISQMVKNSSRNMEKLDSQSRQIGEITSTIEEIADQTNLLALNAAIEAARAGDHGHGFAVVAAEVRTLAGRTAAATREIEAMVRSIQAETRTAVVDMDEGVMIAEKGATDAAKSGAAMDEMQTLIATIVSHVGQIASTAHDQTTTTSEISRNIHEISSVIRGTAQDAQASAAEAGRLSTLAMELRNLVGQFALA